MPNTAFHRQPLARRTLLAGTGAGALVALLSACSGAGASSSSSPAATSGGSATATATATASAGPATAGSVQALAQAFAATLGTTQRAALERGYSLADAEKWSNLPQALVARNGGGRVGLQLTGLSAAQTSALQALLKAATGTGANEGWDEIQQLWNADDYLAANGGGSDYGRTQYYIAFLGSPADSGTWELQFGGHHLALANTYVDGALVGATPSFRGVEPFTAFTLNGRTNRPLQQERAAFSAMLTSLTSTQLAAAKLSAVYSDLVLGPGKDWAFPQTQEGLKVSELSAAQRKLVLAAIARYTGDISDPDGAKILAKYESELDDTAIAWSGTTDLTAQNDYVRIDGPSIWLEFSMQHGIVLSGNHPHSVWRDRTTDYGGTKS